MTTSKKLDKVLDTICQKADLIVKCHEECGLSLEDILVVVIRRVLSETKKRKS